MLISFSNRLQRHIVDGQISNEAHPDLQGIREQRQVNRAELRQAMETAAEEAVRCGASEKNQIVIREGRFCIPVRAGRRTYLGKKAVVLASSGSGQTHFVEPESAVVLNNTATRLLEEEKRVEELVLSELTKMFIDAAESLAKALQGVLHVDLAFARAAHAKWIEGSVPIWPKPGGSHVLELVSCRHPLLLAPSLPSLPDAPPTLLMDFESDFIGPVGGLSSVKRGRKKNEDNAASPPVPLDLTVPADKKVVALTGPNTGGKTATLLTTGLTVLMSKAGLHIPTQGDAAKCHISWFDNVLVDVGDSQSLEQDLSTFSGHVRRLSLILEACTDQSLVLLDEVGSGTDPSDGAALAASLINAFREKAALTVATTHHAEIKTLARTMPDIANASMEFDSVSLMPTYRLQWGQAGSSNALYIAESIGFDISIVRNARRIADELISDDGVLSSVDLDEVVENMRCADAILREKLTKATKSVANVKQIVAELSISAEDEYATDVALLNDAFDEIDAILYEVNTSSSGDEVRDAEGRFARIMERAQDTLSLIVGEEGETDARQIPSFSVGQRVIVPSVGGLSGVIREIRDNNATVEVGNVTSNIPLRSLSPWDPAAEAGTSDKEKPVLRTGKAALDAARSQYKWKKSRNGPKISASSKLEGYSDDIEIQTTRNTLDVRGLSKVEAVSEVERLLGSGCKGVWYIVHGVGTGIVREGVHTVLSKHRKVKSYNLDEKSQCGCTIVRTN